MSMITPCGKSGWMDASIPIRWISLGRGTRLAHGTEIPWLWIRLDCALNGGLVVGIHLVPACTLWSAIGALIMTPYRSTLHMMIRKFLRSPGRELSFEG